jgi:membrane protein DedA with SNARE-associated domain
MWGELFQNHGYWALALGCLLEGETLLLLAGYAAHRGWLDPVAVFGIAAAAGFAGDQFAFWLGRRHGAAVLGRWPALAGRRARLDAGLRRWPAAMVIGVRFAYGLRIAGPLLIGMSAMPAWRFAALNALGAVLWAAVIGGAGWFFGHAAERLLGQLQHLEGWLLLALLLTGAAVWLVRRSRAKPHT